MAQHDLVIENGPGFTVRQDINAALAALGSLQSGSVAPTTTAAYQWWADTGTGLLRQRNAANSAWLVRGSLSDTVTESRTSNTTLTAGDYGKTVVATGTWTQTIAAVSSIGAGWWVAYRNHGTGTITIDPSGSETIDGASAITLSAGESCHIVCSGGALVTVGRATLRLSASNPLADGTATPGATGQAADAGHVHPTDTSRAAAVHGHAIADVSGLQAALDAAGLPIASAAQAQAGTDDTTAITPKKMRDGFNAAGSAPVYACRAWVNFNGTGTVSILASGNVSSITDNGTGDYTINFTKAMPTVNYAVAFGGCWYGGGPGYIASWQVSSKNLNSVRVLHTTANGGKVDQSDASLSVFC